MGKRSSFERIPRDFYPTPKEAVLPLLPFVKRPWGMTFAEPCCGDGDLIRHLENEGLKCHYSSDIDRGVNALDLDEDIYEYDIDYIITNPPWDRKILHPMIEVFRKLRPTWLLFDADWAHTKQAVPYLKYCKTIVSVGRVKWIPDSKHTGKDNCCWYLFDKNETVTEFVNDRGI